jgi:hypothetical protein
MLESNIWHGSRSEIFSLPIDPYVAVGEQPLVCTG